MVFGLSTLIMKSRTSLITGILFVIGLFIFFFIYYCIINNTTLTIVLSFLFSPISILASFNRLNDLKISNENFNVINIF